MDVSSVLILSHLVRPNPPLPSSLSEALVKAEAAAEASDFRLTIVAFKSETNRASDFNDATSQRRS